MANDHINNDDIDNIEDFPHAEEENLTEQDGEEDAHPVDETETLRAENADLKDKLLRTVAEMDNIRKRSIKERDDASKYGVSNLAKELLAVADNLGRAMDAIPEGLAQESDAIANLLTGVKATQDQLTAAMQKSGITAVEAEAGTPFNPNIHEVMFEVESPDHAPGAIVQVMEAGYMIHDRLLRPARVGVAKKSSGGDNPQVNVEA